MVNLNDLKLGPYSDRVKEIIEGTAERDTWTLSKSATTYWDTIGIDEENESPLSVYNRIKEVIAKEGRDSFEFIEAVRIPGAATAAINALIVRDVISVEDYVELVIPWFGAHSYLVQEDGEEPYASKFVDRLDGKTIK